MTSRERTISVFNFEEVDRLPRDLGALAGIYIYRKEELDEVLEKYPSDFDVPLYNYGTGKRCRGTRTQIGEYTDAWGCIWHAAEKGVAGEVKVYPLSDWNNLDAYELPWELLREADLSQVNKSCVQSDKFMLIEAETRPFERMQFLRGTENLLMDLAYGDKEVYRLRDMLHEFFTKELEMWTNTDIDAVYFMDDWGTQKNLLISPALWREFYKPLYKDYCDILHSKGKYVIFHSDGKIDSIYPDLIEVGFNAVNSQLFLMDMEKLGELYAGKIVFWGGFDNQHILPFGTAEEVRNGVKRVANSLLKKKRTGVVAECKWNIIDSKENIMIAFEEWDKY